MSKPTTRTAAEEGDTDHEEESAPQLTPVFDNDGEGAKALVATAELPPGVVLTLPRPGMSPLEDRLARQNALARAASLKHLATWFPGYDFEDAAQNVDARRFCVIDIGNALLEHLDGDAMIDRLLFRQDHEWGYGGVSFSHGDMKGHQPPPPYAARRGLRQGAGPLQGGGLAFALDQRWTTIVNGADRFDPALDAVNLHVGRAYGAHINTNIYLSYGPSKGFGAHWDNHDTIIVPIHGSKRWALFEPLVLSAQKPWQGPEVSDRPLWEGVIEPGLALVIPRGWGHRVDGSEELSVHCTIGVARLETHNMLERVAFEAGFWPVLRADVPFEPQEEVVSYGGAVYDDPQGFARAIAEIATPELVDRAVAAHRARIERRTFASFVDTFRAVALRDWSGLRVRLAAPVGVMLESETSDHVIFAFSDLAVRVLAPAVEAFLATADSEPWSVPDLPAVTVDGKDRRAELASQLVSCGLATVEVDDRQGSRRRPI